jgi:hypothetical protein
MFSLKVIEEAGDDEALEACEEKSSSNVNSPQKQKTVQIT